MYFGENQLKLWLKTWKRFGYFVSIREKGKEYLLTQIGIFLIIYFMISLVLKYVTLVSITLDAKIIFRNNNNIKYYTNCLISYMKTSENMK